VFFKSESSNLVASGVNLVSSDLAALLQPLKLIENSFVPFLRLSLSKSVVLTVSNLMVTELLDVGSAVPPMLMEQVVEDTAPSNAMVPLSSGIVVAANACADKAAAEMARAAWATDARRNVFAMMGSFEKFKKLSISSHVSGQTGLNVTLRINAK
jgi:hypothetical protein